jgi:hypothetical protein
VAPGELVPGRGGRPVSWLGERARLVGVSTDVGTRAKLRQHHERRVLCRCLVDGGSGSRAIALEIADDRAELGARDGARVGSLGQQEMVLRQQELRRQVPGPGFVGR